MPPALRRVVSRAKDPEVDRSIGAVQDAVEEALGKITDPRLITGASVGVAETKIEHGLQRKPLGWLMVSPKNNTTCWETRDPDTRYLYLQANIALSTSLWVF